MKDKIYAAIFALIVFLSVAAVAVLALLRNSGVIDCPVFWVFIPLALPMCIVPLIVIIAFFIVTIKDIFNKAFKRK